MNRTIAEIIGGCLLLMSLIFIYAQRQVIVKLEASIALQNIAVEQLKIEAAKEMQAAKQTEQLKRATYEAELKRINAQPALAANTKCEEAARWVLSRIQEQKS